jgi:hypothetical protein
MVLWISDSLQNTPIKLSNSSDMTTSGGLNCLIHLISNLKITHNLKLSQIKKSNPEAGHSSKHLEKK